MTSNTDNTRDPCLLDSIGSDLNMVLYLEEVIPNESDEISSIDSRMVVRYSHKESRYLVFLTRCPINKIATWNSKKYPIHFFRFSRAIDVVSFARGVFGDESQVNSSVFNLEPSDIDFNTIRSLRHNELIGYDGSNFNRGHYLRMLDLMMSEG
jgi:hypothetical protein